MLGFAFSLARATIGVVEPKTRCLESDVLAVDMVFVGGDDVFHGDLIEESCCALDDAKAPKGEAEVLANAAKPDAAKVLDDVCVDCPKIRVDDVSLDGGALRVITSDEVASVTSLVISFGD